MCEFRCVAVDGLLNLLSARCELSLEGLRENESWTDIYFFFGTGLQFTYGSLFMLRKV